MRAGQFNPWVSRTLERLGEWGIAARPDLVPPGTSDFVKGLAKQIGRGGYHPSLEESIHYHDAFGKATIFAAVSAYSGSPLVGKLAADTAGITVEAIDEFGIKPYIASKLGRPQIEAYRALIADEVQADTKKL